jgi:hypothetical protein
LSPDFAALNPGYIRVNAANEIRVICSAVTMNDLQDKWRLKKNKRHTPPGLKSERDETETPYAPALKSDGKGGRN